MGLARPELEYIQGLLTVHVLDTRKLPLLLRGKTLRFIALTTLLLQPILPGTIILDEPELGLHPSAIGKLAGMIKNASVHSQIIIATQSVNLVNEFSADDIIVADREDNQTVFKRQSNDSLKAWLEDYSIGELWEKNVIGGR